MAYHNSRIFTKQLSSETIKNKSEPPSSPSREHSDTGDDQHLGRYIREEPHSDIRKIAFSEECNEIKLRIQTVGKRLRALWKYLRVCGRGIEDFISGREAPRSTYGKEGTVR